MKRLLTVSLLLLCAGITAPAKTPVELGNVKWIRDIDEGVAKAKKAQKPILVLFQEVPG